MFFFCLDMVINILFYFVFDIEILKYMVIMVKVSNNIKYRLKFRLFL